MSGAVPCLAVAAILLLGLAQKLHELRARPRDPLRRAVCVCLASLLAATLAQLVAATASPAAVTRPATLASDIGAMTAACAGWVFLVHVSDPAERARARARRCYLVWAVALSAVVALFLAFPPVPDADGGLVDAVYLYVYVSYIAGVLLSVCHLGVRYARLTDQPSLRLGLRIIAAGALCGLAFVAVHAVMLAGDELGDGLGRFDGTVALPLEMATESLLLVGVTVPSWGPRLAGPARWLADHRAYRALDPLWLALHRADPDLALVPPDLTRRRWHRDIGFLLYRRVIEIRDGQLAVRPYADPRVPEIAAGLARRAGLAGEAVRAASEAAVIAAGIAGRARGGPPGPVSAAPVPGGADLAAEIAWLTKVADAYARSPVVVASLAAART